MKNKYQVFLSTCFFIFCFLQIEAQEYDSYFADLMNRQEIFALKKHEKLIDSIKNPLLKNIAGSLLHYHFNKPQESNYFIKKMFRETPGLDGGTAVNMLFIMGVNYRRLGCYDSAYFVLKDLIHHPQFSSSNDIKLAVGLQNIPKMEISFDTSPVKIRKDSISGLYMMKIHDLKKGEHEFIIDTGAPYSTVLESNCPGFGIKIIADALTMNGQWAKLGVAPIFNIDKTKIRNAIFFVVPDSIGTLEYINHKMNILGFDILCKADNVVISKETLTFNDPKHQEDVLYNMAFDGSSILVNVDLGNNDLSFMFDSGSSSSFLCPVNQNKLAAYENNTTKDSIHVVGFKKLSKLDIINYHDIPLKAGKTVKIIPNVMMYSSNDCKHGLLGYDITGLYTKTILDFRNMTFKLE